MPIVCCKFVWLECNHFHLSIILVLQDCKASAQHLEVIVEAKLQKLRSHPQNVQSSDRVSMKYPAQNPILEKVSFSLSHAGFLILSLLKFTYINKMSLKCSSHLPLQLPS